MEIKQEKLYTEEEYYEMEHNGLIEYDNGIIIMMAPPTPIHQKIVLRIGALLDSWLRGKSCEVYVAPFDVRLKLSENNIKHVEPDISVICDKDKLTKKGCEGAPDFIIEIVSPSGKSRDYFTKLNWYSQAGVREYWIVNPMKKSILVYVFEKDEVEQYSFDDIVPVGIWDGEFSIDFSKLDLL